MLETELRTKLEAAYSMDGCGVITRCVKENEYIIRLHYYFVRNMVGHPDQSYIQSAIEDVTGGSIIQDTYTKHDVSDETSLFDYIAVIRI